MQFASNPYYKHRKLLLNVHKIVLKKFGKIFILNNDHSHFFQLHDKVISQVPTNRNSVLVNVIAAYQKLFSQPPKGIAI